MALQIIYWILLVYAAYQDYKKMLVWDWLNGSILLLAVFLHPASFVWYAIWSLLVTIPVLAVAVKTNQIGGGDVKFIFANGCMLGLEKVYAGMLLGFGLVSFPYLIRKLWKSRQPGKQKIPLVPYLAAGFFLVSILSIR